MGYLSVNRSCLEFVFTEIFLYSFRTQSILNECAGFDVLSESAAHAESARGSIGPWWCAFGQLLPVFHDSLAALAAELRGDGAYGGTGHGGRTEATGRHGQDYVGEVGLSTATGWRSEYGELS